MTEYRQLEKGEIVQEGDEVDTCRDSWRDMPKWEKVTSGFGREVPDPRMIAHTRYRRKIK